MTLDRVQGQIETSTALGSQNSQLANDKQSRKKKEEYEAVKNVERSFTLNTLCYLHATASGPCTYKDCG